MSGREISGQRRTEFDYYKMSTRHLDNCREILISSFFEKHFRIKTSGKKRRFDLSETIFKLKKKTNEIYIYKYKLGRENVKR